MVYKWGPIISQQSVWVDNQPSVPLRVTSSDGLGLACIFVCRMTDLLTHSQLFLHGSGPSQSSHDVRKSEETQTISIAFLSTPERRPNHWLYNCVQSPHPGPLSVGPFCCQKGSRLEGSQGWLMYLLDVFSIILYQSLSTWWLRMWEELLEVLSSKHSYNWFATSRW